MNAEDRAHYLFGMLEQQGECLVYIGRKDRGGYGMYGNGSNPAHRLAYELVHGPIPKGMTVDHICFNRACCRGKHLRLLTRSENAKRQRKALSQLCKHGHAAFKFLPSQNRRVCTVCARASYLKNREKYNMNRNIKYRNKRALVSA